MDILRSTRCVECFCSGFLCVYAYVCAAWVVPVITHTNQNPRVFHNCRQLQIFRYTHTHTNSHNTPSRIICADGDIKKVPKLCLRFALCLYASQVHVCTLYAYTCGYVSVCKPTCACVCRLCVYVSAWVCACMCSYVCLCLYGYV